MEKSIKQKLVERKLNDINLRIPNIIQENEINYLRTKLNNQVNDEIEQIFKNYDLDGYELTYLQNQKGKQYLIKRFLNKNKTKIRNNKDLFYISNAFKNLILTKEFDFTFKGFIKLSNGFFTHYEAIYCVWNKKNWKENYYYFHFSGYDYEIDFDLDNVPYLKNCEVTRYFGNYIYLVEVI